MEQKRDYDDFMKQIRSAGVQVQPSTFFVYCNDRHTRAREHTLTHSLTHSRIRSLTHSLARSLAARSCVHAHVRERTHACMRARTHARTYVLRVYTQPLCTRTLRHARTHARTQTLQNSKYTATAMRVDDSRMDTGDGRVAVGE